MPSLRFTLTLASGLHARPASMLAEVARRFAAQIAATKEPAENGGGPSAPVDARSVLSLVGLDIRRGDSILLTATGPDADSALDALRTFIETRLPEGDDLPSPPVRAASGAKQAQLPHPLRNLNIPFLCGRPVSAGIGQGVAVIVAGLCLPAELQAARARSIEHELDSARNAIAAVRHDLRQRAAAARAGLETDLLAAHGQIADDPALWADVESRIKSGATAAQAIAAASDRFSDQLRTAASAYIRDRVVDVQDVCMQLVDRVSGGKLDAMHVQLDQDSVVLAETLTANQLLRMDRRHLRGLALGPIGATSHTVILARSLGIPTIIDLDNAARATRPGEPVILDGEGGLLFPTVSPPISRFYQRHRRAQQRRLDRLAPLAAAPATTVDGVRLEVGANASTADETAAAIAGGAEGVGLLRTELLFLDRDSAPSEQEQFDAYAAVVRAAAASNQPRSVIIRTFDIGGDKPARYLNLPREENPFLGVRGLRLYEQHPDLLRTQLRAILRASALGPTKVMAPMVATPTEAAWFRDQVRQVQAEFRAAGTAFDPNMPIGIMIEIPAAAMVIDQLAESVDFFSLGTNDLCQYFMAVDRGNAEVAPLYSPRHPAFLRLLRQTVQAAKSASRWIGVCGEMAGDLRNLPLMIGLGIDEISVAPGEVLTVKSAIRTADASRCRTLLDAATTACRTPAEVEHHLATTPWRSATDLGILTPDLIQLDSDAATKAEAIHDAIDLLTLAGRTDRPREVEDAVWAREATYSTGLGHGFAVPHCKCDAVSTPSLAVIKLSTPIDWNSMDGLPVHTVLLLAIPAAASARAHMQVFATLARRLMHEQFRDGLAAASSAPSIQAFLHQELGLNGVSTL